MAATKTRSRRRKPAGEAAKSIPHEALLAKALRQDEEFAREWEELALARAVAAQVISYRADNGLSQRELAAKLGMSQPQVARLENGEHNPTLPTLMRLATALDREFTVDITPAGRAPKLLTKRGQEDRVVVCYERDESVMRVAVS